MSIDPDRDSHSCFYFVQKNESRQTKARYLVSLRLQESIMYETTESNRTSREWRDHFRVNLTRQRVNWQHAPMLEPVHDRRLVRSLQAWQRGETSDGSHLLAAARKYAKRVGDPDYLDAITLFIMEEQKHGENLGRYLDAIGAPRLTFDLGDWLFRRVRYFNGSIELWTIAVIIVEMFAQFYYASLSRAAECPLLTDICNDILADESHHIRFQTERLRTIVRDRPPFFRSVSGSLYRCLFRVVTISIWLAHGHVFRQNGLDFARYYTKARNRFSRILAQAGVGDTRNRSIAWA